MNLKRGIGGTSSSRPSFSFGKRGVVLVLLFLLVLSLGKAVMDGCYYYPDSDMYCGPRVTQEAAEEDCALYPDCDVNRYFIPGMDCSEIEYCEVIKCNVECTDIPRGECEELGGIEVTDETVNDWCGEGCCKVGEFCNYITTGGTKWRCEEIASGFPVDFWITRETDPEMTGDKCIREFCQAEVLPATLKGYVLDENGEIIEGAIVEIEEVTETTDVYSYYEFTLSPGVHTVRVGANGFLPASESFSLGINETLEYNFTLVEAIGEAELSGVVTDVPGGGISEAMVSWSGPTSGSVLTGADGSYTAAGLVLNEEYTFAASKYGYMTIEKQVTLAGAAETENFVLEEITLQGVEGDVWIDEDSDGTGEYKVYGANIYVDDVFRGYSQYEPLGYYEVSLGMGEHDLYATYLDFELGEKISFTITEGERETQDLVLIRYVGECSLGQDENRPVEVFLAKHVPGEKKVELEWTKPCAEVIGYEIQKKKGEEEVEGWPKTFSPIDFSYPDLEVEWGETYTYTIVAIYDENRQSEPATEVTITLGDKECEGKYYDGVFTSFCLVGPGNRQKRWTCTDENELILAEDCSDYTPGVWYCAQASEIRAICKDTSGCEWYVQEADPFGLYYERQRCYGTEDPLTEDTANYCYFDYTETIVDKCGSCVEIDICFDYESEDACDINNCLGTKCSWLDSASNEQSIDYSLIFPDLDWPGLITEETGHGYCVEEDYKKEDQCELCGRGADIFENYYCTAEICFGLGQCFAGARLSACLSCGDNPTADNNCYAYGTEFECTGNQPLEINYLGEVVLSKDRCGWGRCVWQGNPGGAGTCVKDGDDDDDEDCEGLPYGQINCRMDNQAPQTKVIPEGVNVVSYASPTLTFYGKDDRHHLAVLGYCAASAESNVQLCGGDDFQEVDYLGNSKDDRVEVDLVEVLGEGIKGQTYRLRYYSKDEYSNQENVRETFVFVDTKLPDFDIEYVYETIADTTDLNVKLMGLNELMDCSFELESVLPLGETHTETVGREEREKEVLFEELSGVIYSLLVSCEDDYGNVRNKSENFVFDLERRTILIHPKGAVRERSIEFEVETLAGASCELYKTQANEKIADFVSDEEGKHHKTNPISGFVEGEYVGTHYVICEELLAQEVYNPDYFNFVVDFTGPETQIVLQEGLRETRPSGFGWEESFMESAMVSFECDEEGFGCDKTYYCLTEEDYATKNNPCYEEFTGSLTIGNSTNICYYTLDVGGNEGYPICGSILIDGYGIILIKPKHYWYEGEAWGISNSPVFDWEIMTRVPTQECKFDWIAEFDYENIPLYRVLSPMDMENHYLFEDFPGEVISAYSGSGDVKELYVKCKDLEGTIGPAQKVNLEYDPTAPEITDAYAEPDPVYEGIETTIHVETDDKTLCRYDEREAEYETMQYSFPGEAIDNLNIEHMDVFAINFNGAKKTYNLTAQCKNGADNLSELEKFNFLVDYTVAGNIMSVEPSGYLRSTSVTLRVLTNKNALCQYGNGNSSGFFEVTGGTEHTQQLTGLSEKEYIYLVRCVIGEHEREGQIKFTVDLTPPTITSIDDGNYSCSLSETPNVFVFTDEEAMGGYSYGLYDKGNSSFGAGTLVKNGTVGATMPFKISFSLSEGHTYYFKILAMDEAGNWGATPKESDGFLAVSSDYDRCENDGGAPAVSFVIDEECTKTTVEMYCSDETGCSVDYGESYISSLCDTIDSYSGQKILFDETGWLCYYAEDRAGNVDRGVKKIEFHDKDGDGIADTCDECEDTDAGAVTDDEGCASGQISDVDRDKDTDGDGLPDDWEMMYDEVDCELDYTNDDSTFDGVFDADEDYDADGYDNYDEYMTGNDPCTWDAPPVDVDVREREALVEEVSVLAWVLFILGLLMVLGGSGYLVYLYKFASRAKVPVRPAAPKMARPAAKPGFSFRDRLSALRRARARKEKVREREALFGAFGKESKAIPHVEEAMKKKGTHLQRLGPLVRKHAQIKERIKPGLRRGEKGVFARLEAIAGKAKGKKIEKVVSKGEAKNIFDKLKEISKTRKEQSSLVSQKPKVSRKRKTK